MNTDIEYTSAVEVRASGGLLTGQAVPYGEAARDRPEMFLPGSFITGMDTAALNLQHDRSIVIAEQPKNLTFTDGLRGLDLRAQLHPDGAAARLVDRGALRGLSIEFVALDETVDRRMRVIKVAHLAGVALVDSGSYDTPVEMRARMKDAWLQASIPTERTMACECVGPDCTQVLFLPNSFDTDQPEILAFGSGGAQAVLGSKKRGSLLLNATKKGLQVGLTEMTEAGRRVRSDAAAVRMLARPILLAEESIFSEADGVRTYEKAKVRAVLVGPASADEGHIPAVIEGVPEPRKRRLWL